MTPRARRAGVWAEIGAAAESGWDFSSRWMEDGASLHTARTSEILPVDLNAIMYRFETNLQQLHAMAGEGGTAAAYGAAARRRQRAMSELMWSERRRQWLDVHAPSGAPRAAAPAAASNWLPLWAGAFDARQGALAVQSLRHSGLLQPGGVATTASPSAHQWDWPNAWAPLQDMLIEGLERSGSPAGPPLALQVARCAPPRARNPRRRPCAPGRNVLASRLEWLRMLGVAPHVRVCARVCACAARGPPPTCRRGGRRTSCTKSTRPSRAASAAAAASTRRR